MNDSVLKQPGIAISGLRTVGTLVFGFGARAAVGGGIQPMHPAARAGLLQSAIAVTSFRT